MPVPRPSSPDAGARAGRTHLTLALLLAVAATIRLVLLLREWPESNSDEATTGLMAMHIAEGRHFPGFMYGQSYMGTLEAYAAAAVFRVSGPSLLGLRLPMLVMFLLFLVALHVLARRLYGTAVATVSVGLLALGSRELYGHQLVAQGAMPETLLAGTLLLLLAHRLLATADDATSARRRLAAWGAIAALGLWSSVLVAPFVVTSGVLVLTALRRSAGRPGAVAALGGGLLAGAVPWVLHDVTRPWQDSGLLAVVTAYLDGGTGWDGDRSPGLVSQLTNTLTTSLAYISGGAPLAHPSSGPAWPFGYAGSWTPPTDDVVTTLWGVGLVGLWAAGVTACVRGLRRGRTTSGRAATAVRAARLATLAAAGLTVAAFAVSPTPGVAPANNARYLVGVLVATPAVLAPLWGLRSLAPKLAGPLRAATLLVVASSLALGTVQAFGDAADGTGEAPRRQVVEALRKDGVTHVRSGYLDCNRLTFLSREQVVCAVVAGDAATGLRPGFDRYLPYRRAVQADPLAGYVLRTGDPRIDALDRSTCMWRSRTTVAGYEIWLPARACRVADDEGL